MSKIIGNTTATPTPRSDWNQVDETKADFILNKPGVTTTTKDGLMKSADYAKLQGIEENATRNSITLKTAEEDINLPDLVINKVEDQTAFAEMQSSGLVNDNEFYLVGGADESIKYTAQPLTEAKQTQARDNIGAEAKGVADELVVSHNTDTAAHNDIRLLLAELNTKVSDLVDVDDETKKKLSEIIELIESNKDLIDALQTEFDSHTHQYAGSSSAGGSANSAVKLDSSAGSVTQPVYFSDGKPVATTYTLGASVPSNAVFTDTTYSEATTTKEGLMSSIDKTKLNGIEEGATNSVIEFKNWSTADMEV